MPPAQRRALAYLAWVEALQPFPDGAFHVDEAPTRARLIPALARFGESWHRITAPLLAARLRLRLHLGAILAVAGAVAGMYVRGLAFEYRATSRWTLVTRGQVASNTVRSRCSASVRTCCDTPWALKITMPPSGISLSSSTKTAPRSRSRCTTKRLWTTSWRT